MANNQAQAKALGKNYRLRSLRRCGGCGTMGYVYEAINPEWSGHRLWCYMCGRKDLEVTAKSTEELREAEEMKQWREIWKSMTPDEKQWLMDQVKGDER